MFGKALIGSSVVRSFVGILEWGHSRFVRHVVLCPRDISRFSIRKLVRDFLDFDLAPLQMHGDGQVTCCTRIDIFGPGARGGDNGSFDSCRVIFVLV